MKTFLKGWNRYEILWMMVFCAIAAAVNLASGDNLLGFSVFLSGVLCVVLAAKGNIWTYAVGMYNTFGYAWLAFQNGLFGEVGLNLLFFVPMNLVGIVLWRKHLEKSQVQMRRLSAKAGVLTAAACVIGIAAMGFGLSLLQGQNSPYIDATTNLLSITATLLMVGRYSQQWVAYIVLNLFTVLMWALRTAAGSPDGPMMLVMWSAYLINAIYGLKIWTNGAKKREAMA